MATVVEALSIALDHHLAGRTAEAEVLYRRILDASPGQPDALHLLGMLLAQTGRTAEGLAAIDAAIDAAPATPVFHLNRGKLLAALNRGEEAADSCRAALARQPDLTEAAALLAQTSRALADRAFDAGAMEQAARLYRRALTLDPADHAALFDLAMVLKRMGGVADAARTVGRVGRLSPALLRAHLEEAEAWRACGRADRAAEAFRRAAGLQPLDPAIRLGLALMLQTAGKPAAAEWRAALALEPANGAAWNNLGVALRALGGNALAAGRGAVRIAPDRADALLNLAAAELAAENPRAAAAAGQRAVALEPDSAAGLQNLGCALGALSDAGGAERSLRRALRLDPTEAGAIAQLGRTLEGADAWAAAAPLLRRALAALPGDAEVWASVGRVALADGDAARAEALAHRVLRLRPGLPSGLALLGRALEAAGREEEALAVYDRLIDAAPGLGAGFSRRALLLLGRDLGPPPAPRPRGGGPRLAVTRLGEAGRFGNQLLQYGHARILAERLGLDLETPDWIGRILYGLDDPYPAGPLPSLDESAFDMAAVLAGRDAAACAGRDLTGFFCGPTTPLAPHRDRFRALFAPTGALAGRLAAALDRMRAGGRTLVALHLRRGDFLLARGGRFWIAPEAWYLDWLAALWPTLDRPTLYVATDAPELAPRFAAYAPSCAADLGEPTPGAEFLTDHWMLSRADAVAVSNSSFSVTAAMLNPHARVFVRPDRRQGGLVPFDPWDAPVLLD